jgi:hypothetical protein
VYLGLGRQSGIGLGVLVIRWEMMIVVPCKRSSIPTCL